MSCHFVYILHSSTIDKYYVGYSENPENRLIFHNSETNQIWTKRGKPWILKKIIPFDSKTQALKVERKIKQLKSRKINENIIPDGWKEFKD